MRCLVYYLLPLLFLLSCSSEPTTITIEVEDTAKLTLVKKFLSLQKDLGTIYTNDSTLREELAFKSRKIDTLIQNVLNYKEVKLDYILLNTEYTHLKIEKDTLEKKVNIIEEKYKVLSEQNKDLVKELKVEKSYGRALTKLKDKLEADVQDASELIISGVKIKGVGYTGGLLTSLKEYETSKASKIKKIIAHFSLPQNKFAVKEDKTIIARIYSTDQKTYIEKEKIVPYEGEEVIIDFIIEPMNLVIGSHKVLLLMNGKIQYDSVFLVTQ